MTTLHIFAVNTQIEGRHTYLSRTQGQTSILPDLAGWLGLRQGGLNTDEIELFPADDLAGMELARYVSTAFELENAPTAEIASRLNALQAHVLLIPDTSMAGTTKLASELTLIASLPMAEPDHSSDALQPTPPPRGIPSTDYIGWHSKKHRRKPASYAFLAISVAAIIIYYWNNW